MCGKMAYYSDLFRQGPADSGKSRKTVNISVYDEVSRLGGGQLVCGLLIAVFFFLCQH